jgi:hypothetical protein
MAQIFKQKMTAEIEGEFVVFLIGARINKPWKIHECGTASLGGRATRRAVGWRRRLPSLGD